MSKIFPLPSADGQIPRNYKTQENLISPTESSTVQMVPKQELEVLAEEKKSQTTFLIM